MHLSRKHVTTLFHVLTSVFFIILPYFIFMNQGYPGNPRVKMLMPESILKHHPWLRFSFQNLFLVSLFYLNYLLVAPVTFKRISKPVIFLFSTVFLFSASSIILFGIHVGVDKAMGLGTMPFWSRFSMTFIPILMILALSTTLHLFYMADLLEKKQKEATQMQKQAELLFLQSQINPHFLFNALNNIYAYEVSKNNPVQEPVLRLSELLRFVLYEAGEKFILLSHDIKCVKDYVELQKLRLSNNVEVNLDINIEPGNLRIQPMLVLPFVENAFKHGLSYNENCSIYIKMSLEKGAYMVTVRNKIYKRRFHGMENKEGIGLENVKKRLEIIYPGCHELNVTEIDGEFIVYLMIKLDEA